VAGLQGQRGDALAQLALPIAQFTLLVAESGDLLLGLGQRLQQGRVPDQVARIALPHPQHRVAALCIALGLFDVRQRGINEVVATAHQHKRLAGLVRKVQASVGDDVADRSRWRRGGRRRDWARRDYRHWRWHRTWHRQRSGR
jgi:hypothetical protein